MFIYVTLFYHHEIEMKKNKKEKKKEKLKRKKPTVSNFKRAFCKHFFIKGELRVEIPH